MTVDQANRAWEAMLTDANRIAPTAGPRATRRSPLAVVLRLFGLIGVALLAILVLLPAAIAAQSTLAG